MFVSKMIRRSSGTRHGLQFAALASGVVLTQAGLAQNSGSADQPNADNIEEVVVTGTLIRGAQPTGSELVTFDRQAIVATGAQSTTNLMTNLPQLSSFNSLPIGTVDFANPVPQFNIRAQGGTLVLLNGHRIVGSGILQTTPDPSAIPVAAIERVEVLPDGASATYGADAVGGVVNIILRSHYEGAETHASYGHGDSYHEYDLSQLIGKSWNSGNILASYEYTDHSNFSYQDRSFYRQDLTPFGGRNHFVHNCNPPNVVVNGTSYAAPGLAPGQNLCDPTAAADLLPYQHRSTWLVTGHQDITDNIDLSGDAFYSATNVTNHVPSSTAVFTMTNANPYFVAPPGTGATHETVDYWFDKEFGLTRPSEVDFNSLGIDVDLHFKLGPRWQATLSANHGKGATYAHTPAVDGNVLASAAVATDPAAAFDPFTGRTTPALITQLAGGGVAYRAEQKLDDGQLTVDGPLFALPGGDLSLAMGAQWRRESLAGAPYQLVDGQIVDVPKGPQASSRRDLAEYIEFHVPVVGTGNAIPGVQKLVVSAAGRHDHYSDFGTTTNPKFSLDYSPVEALTLHGTASSSFQAPSLADMRSVDTRLQTQAIANFTPTGPNTAVPEIYIAGGTPTLQPQTAHTYTFGFDIAPSGSGFNAGATYWHSRIKQQISLAFPTAPFNVPIFTNPALFNLWWGPASAGGQVLTQGVLNQLLSQFRVDAANAALTPAYIQDLLNGGYIIDLRRKNLGQTTLSGIDFHVGYEWKMDVGDFNASLAGVKPLHRLNIPGPGAPQADLSSVDPTQARLALNWAKVEWSAGVNVNWVGTFDVTGTDVGTFHAASYTSADVHLTYHTDEKLRLIGNTDITFQVNNLFDHNPPFLIGVNGYTATHANQIGRLITIGVTKRW